MIPTDYRLRLRPDLTRNTFAGTVDIDLRVASATASLVLNARDLTVQTATVTVAGRGVPLAIALDKEAQQLRLTAPAPLAAGEATLHMTYTGEIRPQAVGLYYVHYPAPGVTPGAAPAAEKTLLATHLEATHARQLLPCWDEPVFRARFQLAVELPAGLDAYSNMPVATVEPVPVAGRPAADASLVRTTFQPTPPMPSYLMVLVAGELQRVAAPQDGVDVGVVFTRGQPASSVNFALAATRQLLHYYDAYFGVPYPLPKLDSFALPGGEFGGMENWGGIVYNEGFLLFDPATTPPVRQRIMFYVMAHEMAHQWFGDLVSVAWWDDTWLKEGFATWMGGKATDELHPDWDIRLQMSGGPDYAMDLDARATSHPIQLPVATEAQAADAFDNISYQKSEALLDMFEDWLGPDTMRAGLHTYMQAHALSSATTGDLWQALGTASGQSMPALLGLWTHRPGLPLVRVGAHCDAADTNQAAGSIEFAQSRFRADPETVLAPLTWPVPLVVSTPAGPQRLLLDGPTARLAGDGCAPIQATPAATPVVVDPAARGFFRLAYDEPLHARLVQAFPRLPAPARLKLLQDTWALVAAGDEPLEHYFQLLDALGDEPKEAIWRQVGDRLAALDQLVGSDPLREPLRRRARAVLAPKLARLGWAPRPGESAGDANLRATLIVALSRLDEPTVTAEARQRLGQFLVEPDSLPPSLADAVIEAGGRHADPATYDILLARARAATSTEDLVRYYGPLMQVADDRLAARTLALSLDPATPQLIATSILRGVANAGHANLAWAYAKAHFAPLRARLGPRFDFLSPVVATSADAATADDLVAFAKTHLDADDQPSVARTADAIRQRARTRARLLPQMVAANNGATG